MLVSTKDQSKVYIKTNKKKPRYHQNTEHKGIIQREAQKRAREKGGEKQGRKGIEPASLHSLCRKIKGSHYPVYPRKIRK